MTRLVLIDSNAIIHRAYHALPRFTNSRGKLINAVYGYISILIKIAKDLKPDYLIATFDTPKPTFRHEIFKEYKGERLKAPDELGEQIPLTQKILEKLDIPVLIQEGFEADDLIGSAVKFFEKNPDIQETIIVTGDLDTLQLITKKSKVYTMKKGLADVVIYDEKAVKDRFGFGPELVIDYKALRGDPSDNIPGVKGIGEKTAKELIAKFGNLEKIIEAAKQNKFSGKTREQIVNEEETALFSKELATIKTDIPLEINLEKAGFSESKLAKLSTVLREMGLSFKSLVERLDEKEPDSTIKPSVKSSGKEEVFDEAELKDFDFNQKIYVLEKNDVIYFKNNGKFFQKKTDKTDEIKDVFENKESQLTTFGAKPLLKKLLESKVKIRPFEEDLEIASWLINPEYSKHLLIFLVKRFLDEKFIVTDIAQELTAIEKLVPIINKELEKNGLTKVYKEVELPLTPVIAKMEIVGILISLDELKKLGQKVDKEIERIEKEINDLAGIKINLKSPKQLSELLFEKMKLPVKGIKKTSSGQFSTQESELLKLKNQPIIEKIINLRSLAKLKSTYIEALPKFAKENSKIYLNLLQTGTATGRLASAEPNLQNLPISNDFSGQIREALKASPGFKFIALDYSQIELRALAHLSEDEKMTAAFKNGEDIHRQTASAILGKNYKDISESERQKAKMLNFGLIYGMGPRSFAQNTGVSLNEAKKFMEKYFIEFAGVKKFLEDTKEKARTLGYVETPLGRKRYIGEIGAGSIQAEKRLERMAVNMPIQGFATGDIIKLALIKTQEFLEEKGLYPEKARMILQVHDEILMEVKDELVKEIIPRIKEIMETVYPLNVPLKVKIESGRDFFNLTNLE